MTTTRTDVVFAAVDQMFTALGQILDKAGAHAAEHGIDQSVLLEWRQAPDMFPMKRQVQIATDIVGRGLARLAGAELPSLPDTEESFEALKERVRKTHAFARSLDAEAIDADPEGTIEFPAAGQTMSMPRSAYLQNFVLPNLYFHTTMAYANLRSCGIPLGKRDFLAAPN